MNTIDKIRYILNTLFLIGTAITVILYFAVDSREPFFYAGITSMTLKMAEFILRFII